MEILPTPPNVLEAMRAAYVKWEATVQKRERYEAAQAEDRRAKQTATLALVDPATDEILLHVVVIGAMEAGNKAFALCGLHKPRLTMPELARGFVCPECARIKGEIEALASGVKR